MSGGECHRNDPNHPQVARSLESTYVSSLTKLNDDRDGCLEYPEFYTFVTSIVRWTSRVHTLISGIGNRGLLERTIA